MLQPRSGPLTRYVTRGSYVTFLGLISLICKVWVLIVSVRGIVKGGEGDVGRRSLYTGSACMFLCWCHSILNVHTYIHRQLAMAVVRDFLQTAGWGYILSSLFLMNVSHRNFKCC